MTTGESHASIRVLIADDHALVREGLAAILERTTDIHVVAEAADGEEAIALFRQHQPDVALIDLRMPGGIDGVSVVAALRREFPRSRLLVLTMYDSDYDIQRALQAGAQGFALKGTNSKELVHAVRQVHAGRRYIAPAIASRALCNVLDTPLTPRETEVLRHLAGGASNTAIARALSVSQNTVRNHIANLFTKLQVTSRTQATVIALQRGLVRLDEGPDAKD